MKILVALLLSIGIPAAFVILYNSNRTPPQQVTQSLISPTYEEEHLVRCFFWVPEDEATAEALGFENEELGRK